MPLSKKEAKIITLMALDSVFFIMEITIGYIVNSLALIADSFHMLNDILSLAVALWAVNVAKNRVADAKYTYGWQRAEILGALVNGVFLVALCFTIFIEAIQRFISPPIINNPQLILIVGALGLASNIIGLFLFHESSEHLGHSHSHAMDLDSNENEDESVMENNEIEAENRSAEESDIENVLPAVVVNQLGTYIQRGSDSSAASSVSSPSLPPNHPPSPGHLIKHKHPKKAKSLNMEGVFLHVMGDSLGNVGVMITAILIWKTDYKWKYYFDPLVSLVITCIIFSTAMPLCKSSSRILLQGSPVTIDSNEVKGSILNIPEVISVHDFHIWNLTETYLIATMHAELNCSPDKFLGVASNIKSHLHAYGIHSATIQPEFSMYYARVHMLPKRFASSQNLPGMIRGDSVHETTGLLESTGNQVYGANAKTYSTSDINCMVDASAGCTTLDCI
ncbi:DEKNAAC101471 [Brettanomyces naardenensis]|uniref:DEKNAAC101471 n=1 Tax=Brettanomyces naardenensis TaxID=13370 RepID=A0A448YIB7_BRENA|nr:DEKNAAC101471 [Brettanomyces naardenensis]